jgi:chemotaxis protein MotA
MNGLKTKKYLQTTRKRFDPTALIFSTVGLVAAFAAVSTVDMKYYFIDVRSILVVVGGTAASLLFQFDFSSTFHSFLLIFKSFLGTPDKKVLGVLRQLDDAILNDINLSDLRDGSELDGELLNDIIYMYRRGLLFEEIDEFVTSRISDEYLGRQVGVTFLKRAAIIAPAMGLFGTVMGLIGVLKTLGDPGAIGPSMSLALMTTAYGSALSTLVFTPLSGRLEHHNTIYLEIHQQLLSKVNVLLKREERRLDKAQIPEAV